MAQPTLVLTRVVQAPIERVFAACSQPELLSRWLICSDNGTAAARNTLQVGGHYSVEMARDGQVFAKIDGEYLKITPPHHLAFTWRSANVGVQNSVVTIDLCDTGFRTTELRLTHAINPNSLDGRRFAHGWAQALTNLLHLMEARP
jgi:uncharacterized protein YndB with AHSA1/START domain